MACRRPLEVEFPIDRDAALGEAHIVDIGTDKRDQPLVGAYVDDVSLAERRITVDWGLDF